MVFVPDIFVYGFVVYDLCGNNIRTFRNFHTCHISILTLCACMCVKILLNTVVHVRFPSLLTLEKTARKFVKAENADFLLFNYFHVWILDFQLS